MTERKDEGPELTIVGGQPRRRRRGRGAGTMDVPVGFETLLYRAARDDAFKRQLLAHRPSALAAAGIRLRPSEEAMLSQISDEALARMIAGLVPSNPRGRQFLGKVAAAATSLAAGTAAGSFIVSCEEPIPDAGGIGPDTWVDGGHGAGTTGSGGTSTTSAAGGLGGAGGTGGEAGGTGGGGEGGTGGSTGVGGAGG
jgi:hypothetical protein